MNFSCVDRLLIFVFLLGGDAPNILLYHFDPLDDNIFKNTLTLLKILKVTVILRHHYCFELWVNCRVLSLQTFLSYKELLCSSLRVNTAQVSLLITKIGQI